MRGAILCLVLVVTLTGCAFTTDEGPLGSDDPYADVMRDINAEYKDTWFTYGPTALGNLLGGIAYSPLVLIVAPVEWSIYGTTDSSPLSERVLAQGGYVGGFLLGTPMVIANWVLFKGWDRLAGLD